MPIRNILAILVSTAVLLGACASAGPREEAVPLAADGSVGSQTVLTTNLQGLNLGEARLTPGSAPGRTHAAIAVRNRDSGASLEWRIMQGYCSDMANGMIVGRASSYPAIRVRGDGMAVYNGSINVPFPGDAPHFVVVMASRSDNTVLACGDLRPGI
jgi:hypothetical protein